jgi:hypothetical protein
LITAGHPPPNVICLSFIRGLGLNFSAGSAFAINSSHALAVAASSVEASADPSPIKTDPEKVYEYEK